MNRGRVLHYERVFRERGNVRPGVQLPPPSRMDRLFERRVRLRDAVAATLAVAVYVAALWNAMH